MSTTIRPEVSQNNKYWIEKHRYYELKHFCLQYPIWHKAYFAMDALEQRPADLAAFIKSTGISDPVGKRAEALAFWSARMKMVEETALKTDKELSGYIFRAVTEDVPYSKLDAPCCKDVFYEAYRKFFWLLNKARQ